MNLSLHSHDVVIYPSRKRLMMGAAGCAVFLAVIWFYSPQHTEDFVLTFKMWIATVIGLPFFSFGLLFFIWRLVNPRPVLVADGQGLTLHGTILGPGRLAWNEIAGLRIRVIRKQRMLGVDLHEAAKVMERMPAMVRWLGKMNSAIAGSAFYLPQAMVEYPLEELIGELEQRREAFEMQYRNAA